MKQKSLTGFMNEVIEELCQQERFATAHIYTYALRAFTEFVGGGRNLLRWSQQILPPAFPAPSGRLATELQHHLHVHTCVAGSV